MSSLSVDLNREHLHEIEVQDRLTVSEPFRIELNNHGEAVHVHLHLDDALSRVARLDAGNHYVEAGRTLVVGVETASVDGPVTGRLKIVTGYGAETAYVEVTVRPDDDEKPPVEVDESLGRPQPDVRTPDRSPSRRDDSADGSGPLPSGSGGVLGIGVAALVVILAVATFLLFDAPAAFLVVLALVGGGVAAALLLLR